MSIREIKGSNPKHTCRLGWDHGLETYFARVEDSDIERLATEAAERVAAAYQARTKPDAADEATSCKDSTVLWIGADVREILTVEDLASQLTEYVELDAEMIQTLRDDKEREEATPRTKHQLDMQRLVLSLKRRDDQEHGHGLEAILNPLPNG